MDYYFEYTFCMRISMVLPDIEKIKADLKSIENVVVLDIEQLAKDNGVNVQLM